MNIAVDDYRSNRSKHGLLAPITEDLPCGESVRETPIYDQIRNARLEDNPNLPRGQWDHELKRADWELVAKLCFDAIKHKSKDLQLVIWLLEAEVKLYGLSALGPNLTLMAGLCEAYWEGIHPQMIDGDVEYRTNVLDWLSSRLPMILKKTALAATGEEKPYNWLDLEKCLAAQIPEKEGKNSLHGDDELAVIQLAMSATPAEFYDALINDITQSVDALGCLESVVQQHLGEVAPLMTSIQDLLVDMASFVDQFTTGVDTMAEQPVREEDSEGFEAAQNQGQAAGNDQVDDRQLAYAMLSEAAEFLLHSDPHSPVPYLVFKAIDLGQMDAAELYSELFAKNKGNINVFELLGVKEGGAK
ncbi:type VI secretion system protein TssA [Pseudomonadales bacterium]|nr:type VI secretion system protein TssA [Pseudomonadales bacterium]